MSDSEAERFDSILLALAEQHKNGVPQVSCRSFIFFVQVSRVLRISTD